MANNGRAPAESDLSASRDNLAISSPTPADGTSPDEQSVGEGTDVDAVEAARIQAAMDALPDNINNQARLFYYMVEKVSSMY